MTQMIVYEFTDTLLIPERSFACLPALRDRKAMSVDDSGLHRLKVRTKGLSYKSKTRVTSNDQGKDMLNAVRSNARAERTYL